MKPCTEESCFYLSIHSLVEFLPGSTPAYRLQSDKSAHKDWEVIWGTTLVGSYEPLPEYAIVLEGGAEAADEVEPYNEGIDTVSAHPAPNWTEHTWKGAATEAEWEHDPAMCGKLYGSKGDAEFGTCSGFGPVLRQPESSGVIATTPEQVAHAIAAASGDPQATIATKRTGSLRDPHPGAGPARRARENDDRGSSGHRLHPDQHARLVQVPAPVPKGASLPAGSNLGAIRGTRAARYAASPSVTTRSAETGRPLDAEAPPRPA